MMKNRAIFVKIEQFLSRIYHALPGERFITFHHRHHSRQQSSKIKKYLLLSFGFVLILIGFLLGFVPLVPGFVFALVGFALIATHSRKTAHFLDEMEVKVRKFWEK